MIGDALRLFLVNERDAETQREKLRELIREAEEDFEQGRYTVYDESNLHTLFERIKERGEAQLAEHRARVASE